MSLYNGRQIERFWSNVKIGEANACWPWQKSLTSNGYGQVSMRVDGKDRILKAHKVAWEITNSRTIPAGTTALHTCEHPGCCNPAHVYLQGEPPELGTGAARGGVHGAAKLSEPNAVIIKYRLANLTHREVADLAGVDYRTVWDIRNGKTWRHI